MPQSTIRCVSLSTNLFRLTLCQLILVMPLMPTSWLDPRLKICASPLHRCGTFATADIDVSEVVTVWEHRVLDATDLLAAPPGQVWRRADGSYVWLPPKNRSVAEHFLNHSCDPNLWMANEVTLIAKRRIFAGEELTADYALWELDSGWVSAFRCACGAPMCRGVITGRDWESSDLQQRYAGHFHPILTSRINERNRSNADSDSR